eukprot:6193229-Pleurochrysis_carterae.AAC.2
MPPQGPSSSNHQVAVVIARDDSVPVSWRSFTGVALTAALIAAHTVCTQARSGRAVPTASRDGRRGCAAQMTRARSRRCTMPSGYVARAKPWSPLTAGSQQL